MTNKEGFMFPQKSELRKIEISDISMELPNLKDIEESKSVAIGKWIADWIKTDLQSGKIKINDIIPSKADFAYRLGVSVGTIQNALRYIEDLGYVESKQCIGTLVRDYTKQVSMLRKHTSKRELAIEAVKRYLKTGGFKVGSHLPSSRTISTIVGYSANTTRQALESLVAQNIICHKFKTSRESGWILMNLDFDIQSNGQQTTETLVDLVVKDLENYIKNNLHVGDRMPAHMALSKALKASLKTVHDGLKILIDRGILLARRGRYGTTVVKIPGDISNSFEKPETSIFASAQDAAFYHYEKTQNYLKRMIVQDYEIGDKLPSIMELSAKLDLSPNTIRKAFHNLAKEGYLVFSRGRYGGTFVIDIPEVESQTFKWLAVNPEFAKVYQEN